MDFSTEESSSVPRCSLSCVLQVAVLQKPCSCRALPLAILRPQVEIPTSSQALPNAQVFPPQSSVGENFSPLLWQTLFWDSKICETNRMGCCGILSWLIVATPEWPWLKPVGDHHLRSATHSFLACLLLSCFQSACFKRKTNS